MRRETDMFEYKTGDILAEGRRGHRQHRQLCRDHGARHRAAVQERLLPANFKAYAAACKREEVQPGRMFVFETGQLTNPRFIINFPTKRHWRGKSRMEDIESGLRALADEIRARRIRSIAIPPLGSGSRGTGVVPGPPPDRSGLAGIGDVRIIVFEPKGAPDANRMVRNREVPDMTPGRAALVGLMHRYLGGLLDPFVTLWKFTS